MSLSPDDQNPHVDPAYLEDMAALLGEAYVRTFVGEASLELMRLVTLLADNRHNRTALSSCAHEIKSMSAVLGLNDVAALASRIEDHGLNGQSEQAVVLVDDLCPCFDASLRQLARLYPVEALADYR